MDVRVQGDFSFIEDHGPVTHSIYFLAIRRYDNNALLIGQFSDEVVNPGLGADIDTNRRLGKYIYLGVGK